MKALVLDVLDDLEHDIVPSYLRLLLQYSRKLGIFHKRATLVQEAIDDVLKQGELTSTLTVKSKNVPLDGHTEVEMLLESYLKQVEETVNEVATLIANVQQTQDVIELILDSSRNSLLALDLQVSIGTMGLACGGLVAALFGMNLSTQLENHPMAFLMVTSGAVAASAGVGILGLRKLKMIRRIGLGSGSSFGAPLRGRHIRSGRSNHLRRL